MIKDAKQILWKQAGLSNVIDKIQAPMGYGLDDRFTIVSEFLENRQTMFGGVERACDDIHSMP